MFRLLFFVLLVFVYSQSYGQDQLSQNRVERLYERGTELINHSNYGAAREVFSEFLAYAPQMDSRRGEAEYYIAFSALNLGHADSEKLIDQFLVNNPSSPKAATAYFDLANFFYNQGNYAKASTYFRKVGFPSLTPDQQSEGHFKWGYSLFTQKKLDDALEQFNFVKGQRNSFSPAASYYAAYVEISKEQYDEALTDLKRAESSPSYSNIVPYQIAYVYYKQKKYDEVIQYANSVKSSQVGNQAEISMLVAEAYYYKGDFKNAADAYQRYFEKFQKAEPGLLFRAGYANYITGNVDRGIEYLDRAAAGKDTVSYYASYYLGILYLKQGNKPLALNAFDYARKNPSDKAMAEEGSFQYGKVAYDNGKPDLAITELEKFSKTYPRSARTTEVKELLAQAYVNGNNYNKAIEYIEGLPSRNQYINQAYQKATYLKGSEFFNKEQYLEASQFFEKSLAYPVDPAYVALASFWNGEAYSTMRKYDQAGTNYLKVIGLLPNVENTLLLNTRYALGYAYYNQKAYDKALFNFKDFTNRATPSHPNYSDGLVRLADCYYVAHQYSDALATYNKARSASSADADYVLLQAGVISGVMKQYGEAKSRFNELISKYPKSQYRDEAIYKRAEFDIEQSDYKGAVDGLSQLIREGNNSQFLPYAYMRRAASYYNLKQYDRAVGDYQSVIRQFPTHQVSTDALPLLQEALTLINRSDEFTEYLAMVQKANPEQKGFENLEYDAAKNMYFNQQYTKAITSFNKYISAYPSSPQIKEAKYYLAESYYRNGQLTEALPIYNELAQDPAYINANKVVARAADIYFKNKDYQNAATNYRRLERIATNKKEQSTSWTGLMESYYLLNNYDSTEVYAKVILEKGSANAGAQNKATLYLGKSAMAKGDIETAKDEFLNTLNTAHDESGAEAKYLLATIFYQKKEHKQAYETLISLNNDFAAYEEWVGKSFLLLADNFAATGDIFQARHTLQSLIDNFPAEAVKQEARIKLKDLEDAELKKQTRAELDSIDN